MNHSGKNPYDHFKLFLIIMHVEITRNENKKNIQKICSLSDDKYKNSVHFYYISSRNDLKMSIQTDVLIYGVLLFCMRAFLMNVNGNMHK